MYARTFQYFEVLYVRHKKDCSQLPNPTIKSKVYFTHARVIIASSNIFELIYIYYDYYDYPYYNQINEWGLSNTKQETRTPNSQASANSSCECEKS